LAHAIWREISDPRNPKKQGQLIIEAIPETDENAIPSFLRKNVTAAKESARMELSGVFTKLLALYREVGDEGLGLRLAEEQEEANDEPPDEKTDPSQAQQPTRDMSQIWQKIRSVDPEARIQKENVYYALEDGQEITFNLGNFGIAGTLIISRQEETINITGQMPGDNPTTWPYQMQEFREGACLLLGRTEIAQLLDCGESRMMSSKQMAITLEGEMLVITDIGQGPLQTG
jgi:hypothetical protein